MLVWHCAKAPCHWVHMVAFWSLSLLLTRLRWRGDDIYSSSREVFGGIGPDFLALIRANLGGISPLSVYGLHECFTHMEHIAGICIEGNDDAHQFDFEFVGIHVDQLQKLMTRRDLTRVQSFSPPVTTFVTHTNSVTL